MYIYIYNHVYLYINAFAILASQNNILIRKCSQMEKCLFPKDQNIQSHNRKFISVIIKIHITITNCKNQ